MTPTAMPEPLYEDLGSECWPEQEPPEMMRFEDVPAWVCRLGRVANSLLITAAILLALWVAGAIFVAFHSARVHHITQNIEAAN